MTDLSRRTLLTTSAGTVVATTLLPGGRAAAARGRKRAYVLVVDGCRPEEVSPTLTPTLAGLRDGGLHHPAATSLPIMETIPNHVMMMSGVRPARSGVPANSVFDRELGETRTLDRPRDLKVPTVLERLGRAGFTTATVLSKEYLVGIFGRRATYRWVPDAYVPVSGHVPDVFTMDETLSIIEEHDPNLVFVNLGDIDRFGHSDVTGGDVRLLRQAALVDTDRQVQRLVDHLQDTGAWRDSVVIVLADHSMDWSLPGGRISVGPALGADPLLAGKVAIAENGGAELLYWLGRPRLRDEAIGRMQLAARSVDGVIRAHRRDEPFLGLGPEAGDVVLYCAAGRRFSEDPTSNPIPGNHGHPATRPIPFFIAGGHPLVPRGRTSSRAATTMDVAPTLSRFFGVGGPPGGYDGRNRLP
ncbi:alkaline phosphatase family protein [Nocardioides euryhalodurans]|uniref:Alkaline phosphatase family protein n=1 Tax=Nocardioides euryhalodurans TaxID=2518370 RepID=A0A4P7GKI7_9ACTN|nr:alkaline phosphatase family protein [Nocardioides euryhalodurans]QBR92287.1 alkaline phosphatase family protein [Nocardioides euryhalodurans]